MTRPFSSFRYHLRGWRLIVALSLLTPIGLVAVVGHVHAATGPFTVSGTVKNATGSAVTPSTVTATDVSTGQLAAGPVTTDGTGFYSLTVPGGVYNFQVVPPSSSGLATATVLGRTITSSSVLNFVLVPVSGIYAVNGQVVDGGTGQGIANVQVVLGENNFNVQTDGTGNYSGPLPAGTYSGMYVNGRGNIASPWGGGYGWGFDGTSCMTVVNGITTLPTVTIPAMQSLTIHVQDPSGHSVTNSAVNGGTYSLPSIALDTCQGQGSYQLTSSPRTDQNGNVTFPVFPGTYTFSADPPAGASLATAEVDNISIVAGSSASVTITLPQVYAVNGQVVDGGTGQGIANVQVVLGENNFNVQTSATGFYTGQLPTGTYQGMYVNGQGNIVSPWNGSYSWGFDGTSCMTVVNGITTLPTVTIPAMQSLTIHVQDPSGNPVAGARINGGTYSLPSIALDTCQGQGSYQITYAPTTDQNGDATFPVFPGTYNFEADPPVGVSYATTEVDSISVGSGTTSPVIVTLRPVYPVSGQVMDGATGQGVANVQVVLGENNLNVQTDGSGNYSGPLPVGTYQGMYVNGQGNIVSPSGGGYTWGFDGHSCMTTINGATILPTVVLPTITALTVHVQDPTGHPVANASINGDASSLPSLALDSCQGQGNYLITSSPTTDQNGNVTIPVFPGTYDFEVDPPSGSGYATFTATGTVVTGSQTDVFVIEAVPPTVTQVSMPTAPATVGTTIPATAAFSDVVPTSTHTATWNWGDGTTTMGTVQESSGSGTVSGSHAYKGAGVYTPTLTITSNRGGVASAQASYIVVYDPSAGFVTGGGWISSPAGAFVQSPSLTGKVNFGFVAKYQNGSTVPTGQTQLDFKIANMSFQATTYEWLVISGAEAQFKGTGTINGSGNFMFLVTVIDGRMSSGGGTDKFRIKIWDTATSSVIYDNQIGASDTAIPTEVLGGGSVIIH